MIPEIDSSQTHCRGGLIGRTVLQHTCDDSIDHTVSFRTVLCSMQGPIRVYGGYRNLGGRGICWPAYAELYRA